MNSHKASITDTLRQIEQTENQIAILFGFDRATTVGHYHVSSPGSVTVAGLAVELSVELLR